jgi:hypothetical protein
MKQCTVCKTTYTDDTLRFCLADGGSLVYVGDETFERAGGRANIDAPPTERIGSYPTVTSKGSGSPVVKIVIAVLVLGFLGLLGIGAAGALFYMKTGSDAAKVSSTPSQSPGPAPSSTGWPQPSSTPDADSEELEKELAELQKQLEDIVKKAPGKPTPNAGDNDGTPTAKVNSPKDGFLALRDKPDAKKGARLTQIPHGATVNLENCEKERVTIDGRAGRWCMVTYDDQTGWVFDAWLDY